jgi:nuclear GTP-binding protein
MGKFTNASKGRPSKRQALGQKHKIEKRVKEHNRKLRKEARKMKSLGLQKKASMKKKITNFL